MAHTVNFQCGVENIFQKKIEWDVEVEDHQC